MPEIVPLIITLEITKHERRIIAIDLDDYERDTGTRRLTPELLVDFIRMTPNWAKNLGADDEDVLELDIVTVEPAQVQTGEPPR